jgi:hypothetical protein
MNWEAHTSVLRWVLGSSHAAISIGQTSTTGTNKSRTSRIAIAAFRVRIAIVTPSAWN